MTDQQIIKGQDNIMLNNKLYKVCNCVDCQNPNEQYTFIPFKERIFMGAGSYSECQCKVARLQLDEAFSFVSGLQQSSSEPIEELLPGIRRVEDIVKSLATALQVQIEIIPYVRPIQPKE